MPNRAISVDNSNFVASYVVCEEVTILQYFFASGRKMSGSARVVWLFQYGMGRQVSFILSPQASDYLGWP